MSGLQYLTKKIRLINQVISKRESFSRLDFFERIVMKKIVSALLLSLVASQASAHIANSSIQANLEQCVALAQHGMSNEEILATVQTALDQAALNDSLDIKVKTSANKKFILCIVGGVVVVGVVGTGIYYYLKKSEKPNDLPKKPADQPKKTTNGSETRDQEEPRDSRTLLDQAIENNERYQECVRKTQENTSRSATHDLNIECMRLAAEGQALRQAFFRQAFSDDFMRDPEIQAYLAMDFRQILQDHEKDWAQAQAKVDDLRTNTAADRERENSERAQREADLEKERAELARAQRVLKTMLELDRIAREKEAHEKAQH